MKKIITLILSAILLMTTFLTGCGSKDNNDEQVNKDGVQDKQWSGTVKVQMIGEFKMQDSTDPVSGTKTKGVHVLKEEFERTHPGATVEFVLMGWDSYQQKTQAMLMSGEADVYQVPGISNFASQDLLEPLASYIEKDKYDLDAYIDGQIDGWKAMSSNDENLEIYGLPVLGDTRVIVYDKKLFDDWGVEYLSESPSIDEILEKAKKMTGKNPVTGEQNFGIIFRGKYASDVAMNISESLGGTWGSGFLWKDMKINFNSKEMIQALNYTKEALNYAPRGILSSQGSELFLKENNNIAMNIRTAPGFMKAIYSTGLGDRYDAALLFVNPDKGMGQAFSGSPCSIGKASENKELAWEYLKFTGSEYYQKYLWDEYMALPVLKSAREWESIKAVPQMDVMLRSMSLLWTPRYPYRSGQPRYILATNVEKALLGEMSPEEALNNAQKEAEDWLKEQCK
ncbi:extracellular solute-binding protein [Vallitalea guaymasensis]|uniref:extracellular solute-binding protein n=1 Tax=Vallitalea guaymasensis TaxID=1185412 RepID=UPI002355F448|nr:extracellular solute-binding protein [Vallitalea guaymasensis]